LKSKAYEGILEDPEITVRAIELVDEGKVKDPTDLVKYLKITLLQAIELFNAIAEAKEVKLASTLEASKELENHIKKAEELIPKIEELLARSDELESLYDLTLLTDQKLGLITTVSQCRRESYANRVGDSSVK